MTAAMPCCSCPRTSTSLDMITGACSPRDRSAARWPSPLAPPGPRRATTATQNGCSDVSASARWRPSAPEPRTSPGCSPAQRASRPAPHPRSSLPSTTRTRRPSSRRRRLVRRVAGAAGLRREPGLQLGHPASSSAIRLWARRSSAMKISAESLPTTSRNGAVETVSPPPGVPSFASSTASREPAGVVGGLCPQGGATARDFGGPPAEQLLGGLVPHGDPALAVDGPGGQGRGGDDGLEIGYGVAAGLLGQDAGDGGPRWSPRAPAGRCGARAGCPGNGGAHDQAGHRGASGEVRGRRRPPAGSLPVEVRSPDHRRRGAGAAPGDLGEGFDGRGGEAPFHYQFGLSGAARASTKAAPQSMPSTSRAARGLPGGRSSRSGCPRATTAVARRCAPGSPPASAR